MSHAHKTHQSTRWGDRPSAQASRPVSQTPLGDDRFQSLLAQAHQFFAQAERDEEAERAAAIAEIRTLMDQHGLSVEDLQSAD